jgi:hypothetical protein
MSASSASSADPDALLIDLTSSDPARALAAAKQLATSAQARHIDRMLEVLAGTDDHALRDALALALSDLDEERLLPVVAGLLSDPKTAGHRGTLLYALEPFDCRPILRQLVELAVTGAFEVSRQALLRIESIEAEVDGAVWEACADRIRQARAEATDPEQRAWLEELAELFEVDEE